MVVVVVVIVMMMMMVGMVPIESKMMYDED